MRYKPLLGGIGYKELFDYFLFDIKFFDENFDDISHSSLTLKRSIEKIS